MRTCLRTRYSMMLPHSAGAVMKKDGKAEILTAVSLWLRIIVIIITVIPHHKASLVCMLHAYVHVTTLWGLLSFLFCFVLFCFVEFISWLSFGESWHIFVLIPQKRNEQAKQWMDYWWMDRWMHGWTNSSLSILSHLKHKYSSTHSFLSSPISIFSVFLSFFFLFFCLFVSFSFQHL